MSHRVPGDTKMNREEIVTFAREAISTEPYAEVALPFQSTIWMMDIVQLEKFAALIAAHEREACAKLVFNSPPSDEYESPLQAVYDAIRARGIKNEN